ncbi:MAG: hypothetical protein E3K40_14495 [Candidatus Brocadia sp.]|nr:hypothetical protein [Candidatus Brocadia sp.]MDG6027881.1 hypothetical protein [Candidatus Brocadia sp.]
MYLATIGGWRLTPPVYQLLLDKGTVIVFVPPSKFPQGYLKQAGEIGRQLLAEKRDDHLAPERFEQFFKKLFWLQGNNLDKHGILKDLAFDPELRFSFFTEAQRAPCGSVD